MPAPEVGTLTPEEQAMQGMPLDKQAEWITTYLRQLAGLITQAKAAGNLQAVGGLKNQYDRGRAVAAKIRSQLSGSQYPSSVMQNLDKFSDEALKFSQSITTGVASTIQNLPIILLAGVALFLFLYKKVK